MATAKVVRKSLKDQIKKILIERIVEGTLLPGDRIKELQVAQELGTSQAPVREAIRCLESLGYVDHIPHVGAMVKSFNRRELEEAYQVREAVEVFAVAGLGEDARDPVLAVLDQCLADMQTAVEQREIQLLTRADNRFPSGHCRIFRQRHHGFGVGLPENPGSGGRHAGRSGHAAADHL